MQRLPQFPTSDQPLSLLQTRWASIIQPVLSNPITDGILLTNIILSSSSNINHTLGRELQGWIIVRQRGAATIYDIQDTNSSPARTLLLKASSGVSVDLYVF